MYELNCTLKRVNPFRIALLSSLNTFLILVLPLFLISSQSDAAVEDTQLINSSENSLTFRVHIDEAKLISYVNPDGSVSYYQPAVFAIPADGDILSTQTSTGIIIPIQEDIALDNVSKIQNVVEYSEPLFVRGKKLITAYIFPITGSGIYNEVTVTIQFSGTAITTLPKSANSRFDKMLSGKLINFDQSLGFNSSPLDKISAAEAGPFTGQSDWIKIAVNQTGLYRVSGSQLDASGITISGSSSDNIHLFNGGGKQLPVLNEDARPTFSEIAIIVEDGGDGIFNSSDYILFYGESQNRWVYESATPEYIQNHYTDRNIYWLQVSNGGGLRMSSKDVSLNGIVGGAFDTTITTYRRNLHVEQDVMLRQFANGDIEDYYTWYWTNLNDFTFTILINGMVSNDTADVVLIGKTIDTTGTIDDIGYIDMFVNGTKGISKNCNPSFCTYRTAMFTNGSNTINLSLTYNKNVPPYFDCMDVTYTSYIQPVNNLLDFSLGSGTDNIEVEVINNFSANPLLFDISDPSQPVRMINADQTSPVRFYDIREASKYSRYLLTPLSSAKSPLAISAVSTNDLYTTNEQADIIVISPEVLLNAMSAYVDFRSSDGFSVMTVSIEDIMDNFGYGMYDPTAIRDFLKFTYENYPDPKPSAALFVGDANYDFRNILATGLPNYVPAYIHPFDNSSSDDNYVYFGDYGILDSDTTYDTSQVAYNQGFDMIVSRWPVRSSSEIAQVTSKILNYESSNNFGIWRNNITLVADDEYGSTSNEYFHTTQIEELQKYYLPSVYNREKIYLWEYPFVSGDKPAVNDAIVNSINRGTLLANYVGHGNPQVWAHENVFTRSSDLPRLTNRDKLPMVLAASCAIGFFDDPLREGMAEDLLSMGQGGAIGVISATRLVYSSDNSQFNKAVYTELFNKKSLSICEAVYAAKISRSYSGGVPRPLSNDRNYLFFGDPVLELAIPEYDIQFIDYPDSLLALGKVTVSGEVVDDNGSLIPKNGILSINVFDSEREKTYQLTDSNGDVTREVDYTVTGPTIFRGEATVTNGQFSFEFLPPLDIGFGGNGAKISAYAALDDVDASGIVDSISVSDSIVSLSDSIGPQIEVVIANRTNFVSGDYINAGDNMAVTLSDPTGINLVGGLGHGITLEIDNSPGNIVNLTNLFTYDRDDYTTGSLNYTLNNLSAGVHTLKIKAWDNNNNFSKSEFDVTVNVSSELSIIDLLNYPNPMSNTTTFSYTLTQAVEKLSLEIFTLSGKKIKTFTRENLAPAYYDDIIWNGRDTEGDRVATEVYIYKATAYPSDGGDKVESFGKIIVVN